MNRNDMTKHLRDGRTTGPQVKAVPPGTPIQVDLKNATKQVCICGCDSFIQALNIFKVSAIISPTGQELIANQQIVICSNCKKPFGQEEEKN